MTKILICLSLVVLYQTWPTFAYTHLLMQNSIHSRKKIEKFWKKFGKMLLVVHLSFLHAKHLLMKLSIESLQTFANLLLGLLPANYIPIRCVNPCLPIFIRVGIWIQKRVDSHLDKTRPAALRIWSSPISHEQDQNVKSKASSQEADRRKLTAAVLMSFVLIATLFEAMGSFYDFCPCQELRPSLTEEGIKRGGKKRRLDALRRLYIQEKGFKVFEMWECDWWRLCSTSNTLNQHILKHFAYRPSLGAVQLLEEIKEGKSFGYVQCDIEVPENLRSKFVNFPPIFKNTLVSRSHSGDLMKNYAEEDKLLSQPQKMLISSFILQNGTPITPLLLFYLKVGPVATKIDRFV